MVAVVLVGAVVTSCVPDVFVFYQKIMHEPVILCNSGLSYERACIEGWLRNNRCGHQNRPLPDNGAPVTVSGCVF